MTRYGAWRSIHGMCMEMGKYGKHGRRESKCMGMEMGMA
jgi:hypothetical protein